MNKTLLIILLISALVSCKAVEETSINNGVPIIQQYHEGLRAYLKGDYVVADNMANRVIALAPQHDGALYLKSKIYYDQGRLDESAKFLLKAGLADPNNEYLSSEIAFMYSSMGKYNEAGLIFDKLISSNPRETSYYFGGFENYLQAKNYKAAVKVISQQESAFGFSIETCLNRYKINLAQNETKDAIEQLEKGVKAFPNEPLFLAKLIDLYFQRNEHNKAIPFLEKLCETDPENGMAKFVFGEYLINTGQFARGEKLLSEAVMLEGLSIEQKSEILLAKQKRNGCSDENIQLFSSFVQNSPNILIGHTLFGDLFILCNQPDSALIQYKLAVSINPEAYPIWKQLLLITYKEEQWDSLIRISSDCISLFPMQPMPYLTLATAKNKIGQLDDAEKAINMGSELIVGDDASIVAEFCFQRGVLALNKRLPAKATTWFNEAMKLQPENIELKADIGNEALIYSELIAYSDSLIADCLTREPSNPKFMAIKGRIFYIKNEFLLANSWLEKAIIHGYPQKLGNEWLGDCAFQSGDIQKAKYYWLKAVSLGNHTDRLRQKIISL